MAKRLATKHKKMKKDLARAYKEGTADPKHKVAVERSVKDKFRKINRMA